MKIQKCTKSTQTIYFYVSLITNNYHTAAGFHNADFHNADFHNADFHNAQGESQQQQMEPQCMGSPMLLKKGYPSGSPVSRYPVT